MIDLLDIHASLWGRIQQLLDKKRIPQVFLFVGPRHTGMLQFANRLMATLICRHEAGIPCGRCRACHLLMQGAHPDIHYVRPDTQGGAIKIEQVRELQHGVYQTPKRGTRRFIVIEPADKMNIAASNALLKILEEPPSHTMFILIAEQISSIPATMLSRCQKYTFSLPTIFTVPTVVDYLAIGQQYPGDSSRAELLKNSNMLIAELCDLTEEKVSPCTLAARWSTYGFDDLLWLLYLITAQAVACQLIETSCTPVSDERLVYFSHLLQPIKLLSQLEQINAITQKMHHNVNMNQTLVVEDLLLGYIS